MIAPEFFLAPSKDGVLRHRLNSTISIIHAASGSVNPRDLAIPIQLSTPIDACASPIGGMGFP